MKVATRAYITNNKSTKATTASADQSVRLTGGMNTTRTIATSTTSVVPRIDDHSVVTTTPTAHKTSRNTGGKWRIIPTSQQRSQGSVVSSLGMSGSGEVITPFSSDVRRRNDTEFDTCQTPGDQPQEQGSTPPNGEKVTTIVTPPIFPTQLVMTSSSSSAATTTPGVGDQRRNRMEPGLSELARQLRDLQNKYETQQIEMARLQRQIRILSDLEGVSVSNLRHALQEACAAEAHGELLHQVALLRAQLETYSSRIPPLRSSVPAGQQQEQQQHQQLQLQHESARLSHRVADLELQIGEMEELHEKQRGEITTLYEQLATERDRATKAEGKVEQLETELRRQEEKVAKLAVAESIKGDDNDHPDHGVGPAITTTSQQPNDDSPHVHDLLNALHAVHVELQLCQGQLALSKQKSNAVAEQSRLQQIQSRARAMVQDERIRDLDQQLSSLYTAFDMLQQEQLEQESSHRVLRTNLDYADAQVARDLEERGSSYLLNQSTKISSPTLSTSCKNGGISSDTKIPASALLVPTNDHFEMQESPPHQRRQAFDVTFPENQIMAGSLLVRSRKGLRSWKRLHVVLCAQLENHTLYLEDGRTFTIEFGISQVIEHNKQPFTFALHIHPSDPHGPILYAAASSLSDFYDWMDKLLAATTGEEYHRITEEK